MFAGRVRTAGRRVGLLVQDDGKGFAPAAREAAGGLGLTCMRERAEPAGGRMTLSSSPGAGTTVRVVVKAGARSDRLWPGFGAGRPILEAP